MISWCPWWRLHFSRSIAGIACMPPGLLVELAFHAFILRGARPSITHNYRSAPRVAQA
jgi:hypothetical protein